ncbi:MAG: flippase-like domain-containing protein, partial [Deltaproteobacteria bacterium]|nr:flippase-like domain-containing protein [Deltaproteobacteria bacterium]
MKRRLFSAANGVFALSGIILFAFVVRSVGLAVIWQNILAVRWAFLAVLAISAIWYILYAEGWRLFLKDSQDHIGLLDLFRIKIIGEAINTLTPVNFIGGDPLRIYLLKKHGVPVAEGAASVVVDRTVHILASMIILLFGLTITFLNVDRFASNVRYGIPAVAIATILFIIFILIHQRRGFFGPLMTLCKKLRIKKEFSEKTIAKFVELDSHIADFYNSNHRGFLLCLGYNLAGRILGIIEIYVVGHAVVVNFTWYAAIVLCTLAPVVNTIFTFIPGAIGVMEGAFSGVSYLLGFDPATGMTIQIIKRIRSFAWVGVGLIFLGFQGTRKVLEEDVI